MTFDRIDAGRSGAIPVARATSGAYAQVLGTVTLTFTLLAVLGVWMWPPVAFEQASDPSMNAGAGGLMVHFLRLTYGVQLLAIGYCAARWGTVTLVKLWRPFVAFFLSGVVAAAIGFDLYTGFRLLAFWLLMVMTAASINLLLQRERMEAWLIGLLLAVMVGSVVVALALPTFGATTYGSAKAWRGLFSNKNQLGWVGALALLVAVFTPLRAGAGGWMRWALAAAAVACLVGANSSTSIVTAVLGMAAWAGLGVLKRRMSLPLVAAVLCLALLGLLGLLAVDPGMFAAGMRALGRDATLTGRTEIWPAYLASILRTPWFGQGPGAYTDVSPFTVVIAARFVESGGIFTPHNMFLGALGDGGAFGLAALVGGLLATLLLALRGGQRSALGPTAIAIIVGGMAETRQVYSAGPAMFLLILLLAQHASPSRRPVPDARAGTSTEPGPSG